MSPNHYGKAYAAMFHRSMSGKGPLFFAVWTYVCSHAYPAMEGDEEVGHVELNPRIVAALIGQCTEEEVRAVLGEMCSPDPLSESKLEEGRRLIQISQYTYRVVTFMEYRARISNSPEARANAEKSRRWRQKRAEEAARLNGHNHVVETTPISPEQQHRYNEARIVLAKMVDIVGIPFKDRSEHLDPIAARLAQPEVTRDGCIQMIQRMTRKWKNDARMSEFLRPSTLFGNNFPSYYDQRESPVTQLTPSGQPPRPKYNQPNI